MPELWVSHKVEVVNNAVDNVMLMNMVLLK